mgnify:CR=1 FL=1
MTDAEKWTLLCKWSEKCRVVIDWMPVRGAMPKTTLSLGTRVFVIGKTLDECIEKAQDWVKDREYYYV